MNQEVKDELDLMRKLAILERIDTTRNVSKELEIPRSSFIN